MPYVKATTPVYFQILGLLPCATLLCPTRLLTGASIAQAILVLFVFVFGETGVQAILVTPTLFYQDNLVLLLRCHLLGYPLPMLVRHGKGHW